MVLPPLEWGWNDGQDREPRSLQALAIEKDRLHKTFYPCLNQAQVETTSIIFLFSKIYVFPQTTLKPIKEPYMIRLKQFCHNFHKPMHLPACCHQEIVNPQGYKELN